MRTIHVNVSKPYDVLIGYGVLDQIGELIKPVCKTNRIAIITDDVVEKLYMDSVCRRLNEYGFETIHYSFLNGEKSKNIDTLSQILEFLAERHITRKDTLIALGGGVVGDIVGLAAALYMRGVSVIQIPTTLLSAVDSSVGGKTAVDLKSGKNLVGAFWQPSLVICDVDVIRNLPVPILYEGMAEVIKCCYIRELPIVSWIESKTIKEHLEDVVFECIRLKRDIVEKDEYDVRGIRNILNVGHTFAHAIEKLSGYSITHGHAVGTGLVLESEISYHLGKSKRKNVEEIRNLIEKYALIEHIPWSSALILDSMKTDKKNIGTGIMFELPIRLGETQEACINPDYLKTMVDKIIDEYNGRTDLC